MRGRIGDHAALLHERMEAFGIGNRFEIDSGDHGNAVADRFQTHVLPFFARILSFKPDAKAK